MTSARKPAEIFRVDWLRTGNFTFNPDGSIDIAIMSDDDQDAILRIGNPSTVGSLAQILTSARAAALPTAAL